MVRTERPLTGRRRFVALALGGSLVLAGCGSNFGSGGLSSGGDAFPEPTPTTPPLASGDTIGAGSVRVGLVLPKSAGGQSAQIAAQLRNAAELALKDFPNADIQITVLDDAGTTEGGQAAASQAVAEGAQLIIGPLNAVSARGVAGPARAAGLPVVAFTTDTSVATRGVYLIGFLPAVDAERIVSYAASQNRKSVAAIVPDDAYGLVIEAAFREAAARYGMRVMGVERYKGDPVDMQTKAAAIAKFGAQIDSVFVPDAPQNAQAVVQAMFSAGLDRTRVKLLGSGRWNDPTAFASPVLAGGWFPGADSTGIDGFRARYRASFQSEAGPLAVLGYEAVFLSAGLVRNAGARPFRDESLLSRNGFLGVTGLFRFKPDGTSERGLAVFEIGGGTARTISPAPKQFPAGT
ncbi:penicillin-binding protein activator [Siculibacillus lacustris]|uniref:penicillin-binding protein activator n=1 Tax=Siculibacillus lacustris TaxID=1549641 RepID=UPI0013F17565|nr:penicillin-binding protein activator [Siculibacillus lacustris]